MRSGSQVKRLAGDGGRRQEALIETIFRQRFESSSRAYHCGFAFLAEEPDFPVGVYGRGGVFASNPFLPDQFSRLRLDATGDAGVVDHVNQIVNQQDRWFV